MNVTGKTRDFQRHYQGSAASISKMVVSVVIIFITVTILVLTLAYFQAEITNAVRAYIRSEGLWAKSQKDAIIALQRYARTGNENHFAVFQDSTHTAQGVQAALVALQSSPRDVQKAYQGFIQGRNSKEDAEALIWLFVWFHDYQYMREAISVWQQTDNLLIALEELGESLHKAQLANDKQKIVRLLSQLNKLNAEFAKLEDQFSSILSKGGVQVKKSIMLVSFILLMVMLGLVLKYSHKVIRLIEQKEKKLLISENRFKSLFYSDIVAVFEWHLDGRIFDANNAFLDMIGYEREELVNSRISWRELTPDAGEERDRQAIKEIQEKGFCMPFEKQYIHKSGRTVSILLGAALLGGETQKGIAFAIDLTDKKKAEENVRLLASVFNSTSNAVIITDKDFKVVSVNQTYQQQTGYSEEQIVDQLVPFLSSSVISDRKREVILNQLNLNSHYQHDISYLGVAGKEMASMLTINEINDDNGVVTHYAFILTDISELKEMEEKLKKLAHYDLLTGLANRKLFNDRVKKALQRAKRNKSTLALLFLDLDGFKPVNDQYGHDMGDKLLTQVARRLKESVRENDSVARFGGDEFVILLEGLDYAQAAGNVARKLIENLNRPFFVDNICLKLGCSIGISLYPDDSDELEALIRFGDIAMYAAKSSGRNRYYYFNPKLDSFGDNGSSSEISDPPSSS